MLYPDVNMRLDNQPQPPDAAGAGKESRRHSEP